jgi:hypothetical protein
MLKNFVKYYLPALLAFCLIAEIGLRLSHVLQPLEVVATPTTSDSVHRVLLVSDSILGTMADKNEAAGQFVLKLTKLFGDKFSVSEISKGGLLTAEVETKLEKRVADDRVSTVILMIGKSDWVRGWVDRNFGNLAQTWIMSLEVSKLLIVLAVDIQKQISAIWPDRMAVAEHKALVLPWKLYSTKDIRGIEAFEAVMLDHPNNIRAIRALVHLYYVHLKVPEGILFLEKLAAVSEEADFVRLQIANLKYDLEQHTQTKILNDTVAEWDKAIKSLPDQRLAFLARMRYLMRTGDAAEFANYYASMTPEQSDVLLPSTYATLSRVVEKAVGLGLRVIILEYPSNHGLPQRRSLAQYEDRIEIYETRSWLLESVEAPRLMHAFKVDIEHLTPFGAEKLADQMVSALTSKIETPSPSEK